MPRVIKYIDCQFMEEQNSKPGCLMPKSELLKRCFPLEVMMSGQTGMCSIKETAPTRTGSWHMDSEGLSEITGQG